MDENLENFERDFKSKGKEPTILKTEKHNL